MTSKSSMFYKNLLIIVFSIYLFGCNNNIPSADAEPKNRVEIQSNTIPFEGKFFKIEKINDCEYSFLLKNENDSVITFLTMMLLNDNEIQFLKKDGNNIRLNYSNFYNPVKKMTEKIVKSMEPIYEFENNKP